MAIEYELKFWTDREDEVVDGKPTGTKIPVDWVSYAPAVIGGKPNTTHFVNEKVRRLDPANFKIYPGQDGGAMMKVVEERWSAIGPAYHAWKEGREVVTDGTALNVWTTLRSDEMDTLLRYKIRTVEAVAKMSDNQCSQMPLPNAWGLRDLAKEFLASRKEEGDSAEIAALKAQIEHLQNAITGATINDPKADEANAIREELEARGISYDKRIRDPDKLRAILNSGGIAA